MNTTTPSQTALDEILRLNPGIDPKLLAQVKQASELLRQFGLLSTEPTEAIRPFTRQHLKPTELTNESSWTAAHDIQFTKME